MVTSFLIALAAGAAQPVVLPAPDKDPRTMSQSEIRASNVGRLRTDPNFIRCQRGEETGSLIRKTVTCQTNSQWAEADRIGGQNARDTFSAMQGKAINQSN